MNKAKFIFHISCLSYYFTSELIQVPRFSFLEEKILSVFDWKKEVKPINNVLTALNTDVTIPALT